MVAVFNFVYTMIYRYFQLLHGVTFVINGVEVSLFYILVAFGILTIVTSVFWKGGNT